MPIFEYACRACGHEFETLVRGAETPACARATRAVRRLRPSRRPRILRA